jgi:hypothetical protein
MTGVIYISGCFETYCRIKFIFFKPTPHIHHVNGTKDKCDIVINEETRILKCVIQISQVGLNYHYFNVMQGINMASV